MAGGVLRKRAPKAAQPLTASAEVLPMQGSKRAEAARYRAPRAITAAAETIDIGSAFAARARSSYTAWQMEAWTGYERVGEIHYAFQLVSNVLSRLRIYAAVRPMEGEAPVGAKDAAKNGTIKSQLATDADELMTEIDGPAFSNLARTFGLNMNVPGECYLVRMVDDLPNGQQAVTWKFVSTDELVVDANGAVLRPIRGDTASQKVLQSTVGPDGKKRKPYIGRVWRPHPRYSGEPDSSMTGVADLIEELLILQRLVRSASRSRLNNGLLFLPDGLLSAKQFNAVQGLDENGEPLPQDELDSMVNDQGNSLVADLMQAFITAVQDEGDASAVAPVMITGEGGLAEQIKWITFDRRSDDWLVQRTEKTLERILSGLDVPKEVITGFANVKYSNALVIDENLYKAHIEPLALVLVDALTAIFLRPMLRAKGYSEDDINRMIVWYDPSEIVTRKDQASDADKGFAAMVLGPEAWRREHGFSDDDKPSEADLAMMILTKGSIPLPPDVQQALLKTLLPTVLGTQREASQESAPVPFPQSAEDILQPSQEAAQAVSNVASTGEVTAA
jgi:hypothetical protein